MNKTLFSVGNTKFASKAFAYDYFKKLVAGKEIGAELDGIEFDRMCDLIAMHPNSAEKIGPGIARLKIDASLRGMKGILIHRLDGSVDDVSIKKCIFGEESMRQRVKHAMRLAVQDDIAEIKTEWFHRYGHATRKGAAKCAISGRYIKGDMGHMDHIPPMTFEVIATTFMVHIGKTFDEIALSKSGLRKEERILEKSIEMEFRLWHSKLAQMRFIANDQNHYDEELARIKQMGMTINLRSDSVRSKDSHQKKEHDAMCEEIENRDSVSCQ